MGGRNDAASSSTAPPVKDFVVERRKKKKQDKASSSSSSAKKHAAVEGYTPKTGRLPDEEHTTEPRKTVTFADTTKDDSTSNEEPVVFSSLADMMQAAGTLPDQTEPIDPSSNSVIEADLQFSCMAPEDYEALQNEAAVEQERVFLGLRPPDENTPEFLLSEEEDGSSRGSNGGDLWDVLGDDSDDETENAAPPRSFLKLWTAISQWVTPQAVNYVRSIRRGDDEESSLEPVLKTDIEASRCAALMNLLKRHVVCKDAKHHAMHASTKLGNLLRCFDYAQPSPDLDGAHARALAWILLESVATEPNAKEMPQICVDLEMDPQEYGYLVESAICSFSTNTT